MTTLYIDASDRHSSPMIARVSRGIADDLGGAIKKRVLTSDILFHADLWADAVFEEPEDRSLAQQGAVELVDEMLGELLACDTVVISGTLSNNVLPDRLVRWLDLMAKAYGYDDAVGFANKSVITVLGAKGGNLSGQIEHVQPILLGRLAILGIEDIRLVPVSAFAGARRSANRDMSRAVFPNNNALRAVMV